MSLSKPKKDLETLITNSKNKHIPDKLKIEAYNLLDRIRQGPKNYGAALSLGHVPSMRKYAVPMDVDVFEDFQEENLISIYDTENIDEKILESLQYDGAVLFSSEGKAISSGNYLRGDPTDMLKKRRVPNHRPISDRLGFKTPMGTRHCVIKSASENLYYATILVLSEEYQTIRGFERGYTISSPYNEEIDVPIIKPSLIGRVASSLSWYGHGLKEILHPHAA